MRLGVLPFLLLIAIIVFSPDVGQFLTGENLVNVRGKSTYLTMVAMGQMLALLTGGFDLSVGTDPRGHLGGRRAGHGGAVLRPIPMPSC